MKTLSSPILSIDTGHADGSVAVLAGAQCVVLPLGTQREHARLLAAAVRDVMAQVGCRYEDLACIAINRGPGSFTGLRVGVASAKAIAWSSSRPLVAFSSFESFGRAAFAFAESVEHLRNDGIRSIPIAFDAGRGDVFAARATASDTPGDLLIGEPTLMASDRWFSEQPEGTLVIVPHAMRSVACDHGLVVPDEATFTPTAEWGAMAGAPGTVYGESDDPFSIVPVYMRPSYAEEHPATNPPRA